MYMYSKCNSNFKFNRKPWPKDYTMIHPGELLIWYYRYCKVWINKVLKMFWNENAWNMKDFLLKYMKTEINEFKKKKVFKLSSTQKEIQCTYWWVGAWMSEILNKGKAWSSWKTAEYKPSSPEPSKMAANRTSDDFGSIKTPLIAVCPWKFNKLIWLKDIQLITVKI